MSSSLNSRLHTPASSPPLQPYSEENIGHLAQENIANHDTKAAPIALQETPSKHHCHHSHSHSQQQLQHPQAMPFLSPKSHVDPIMLFHTAMISSSPPSKHSSSIPTTPKTFSHIIYSSPLYQGFKSSPVVHADSPSNIPHLIPLSNFKIHTSKPALQRAFDFESIAKRGLKRKHILIKKSSSSLRAENKSSILNSTSLYHRRRNFLNSRRKRQITASSPIQGGSPKFPDSLHFSNDSPVSEFTFTPQRVSTVNASPESLISRQLTLGIDPFGRAVVQNHGPTRLTPRMPTTPVQRPPLKPLIAEPVDKSLESSDDEDDDEDFRVVYDTVATPGGPLALSSRKPSLELKDTPNNDESSLLPSSNFSSPQKVESVSLSSRKVLRSSFSAYSPSSVFSSYSPALPGSAKEFSIISSPLSTPNRKFFVKSPKVPTKNFESIFPELKSPFLSGKPAKSSPLPKEADIKAITKPHEALGKEIVFKHPQTPQKSRTVDAKQAFCSAMLSSKHLTEQEKESMKLKSSLGVHNLGAFSFSPGPGKMYYEEARRNQHISTSPMFDEFIFGNFDESPTSRF